MSGTVSFRGQSGQAWTFQQALPDAPWARAPGVAIFAAPDACGWRVYRVMELSGRPHDAQPIWALMQAERFGASAVFVAQELVPERRRRMIADLDAAFTQVCRGLASRRLAA